MTECLVCSKNFSRSTGLSKHLETEAHKRKVAEDHTDISMTDVNDAPLDKGGQYGGNSLMDFDIEGIGDDNDGDDNQGDHDDDGGDESEDDYATRLEATFVSRFRSITEREVELHDLTDSASDGCGYRRSNYPLCGQPVQIRILLDAEHPI
ncbi:hypothetical protein [Absidia glauca]|uniref:C2H2-type domain-containing protein n=1 Tax=Absidia glauca TaxID=4829 RepID=A0A168R1Y8_ABSGL|nr:hypothetical protein [Absidia glauca]